MPPDPQRVAEQLLFGVDLRRVELEALHQPGDVHVVLHHGKAVRRSRLEFLVAIAGRLGPRCLHKLARIGEVARAKPRLDQRLLTRLEQLGRRSLARHEPILTGTRADGGKATSLRSAAYTWEPRLREVTR